MPLFPTAETEKKQQKHLFLLYKSNPGKEVCPLRTGCQTKTRRNPWSDESHCDWLSLAQWRQTFPELWRIVVLVLQTLSLLTMSLVTSTSASTKLLCFRVMSSSRSVLIVERFLAMILALMAAIFSTDIASDRDLTGPKKSLDHLNSLQDNVGYWRPP